MQPMLVREIRDPSGETVRARSRPRPSHRVFSESTTRALREMLAAVVDSGTAKAARVPGLRIAGKTGTAQKYDAAVGTYGRGMYLSSFAGFAPADDPCLVGVVVIDEPRGRQLLRRRGGGAGVPRACIEDLRRLPARPAGAGIGRGRGAAARAGAGRRARPAAAAAAPARRATLARARAQGAFRGARDRACWRRSRRRDRRSSAARASTAWLSAPGDSAAAAARPRRAAGARGAARASRGSACACGSRGMGVVARQSPVPRHGAAAHGRVPAVVRAGRTAVTGGDGGGGVQGLVMTGRNRTELEAVTLSGCSRKSERCPRPAPSRRRDRRRRLRLAPRAPRRPVLRALTGLRAGRRRVRARCAARPARSRRWCGRDVEIAGARASRGSTSRAGRSRVAAATLPRPSLARARGGRRSPAPTARRRRPTCWNRSSKRRECPAGVIGTTGVRCGGEPRPARVHHARGARAPGAAARDGDARGAGGGDRGRAATRWSSAAATGSSSTSRSSPT